MHQPLGLRNTILLWKTNNRLELYKKGLLKTQSRTSLWKSPNTDGAGNLHGRSPGKAKTLLSQGVSTISEIKKHHIKRNWEIR